MPNAWRFSISLSNFTAQHRVLVPAQDHSNQEPLNAGLPLRIIGHCHLHSAFCTIYDAFALVVAIVCCLVIPALTAEALAQESTPHEQPSVVSEQSKTSAQNSNTGAQKQGNAAEALAGGGPAAVDTPTSAPDADKVSEKHDRYPGCEFNSVEECDLAAQQSMAESTYAMAWIAAIGLFLTVVGLIFLYHTLKYTAKAATHAQDTLSIAQRTIEEARQTNEIAQKTLANSEVMGRAQVRAYLTVTNVNVRVDHGGQPVISFDCQNSGQSPAKEILAHLALNIRSCSQTESYDFPNIEISLQDIGSGGSVAVEAGADITFPHPLKVTIDKEFCGIVEVAVVLLFQDVFKTNITEQWRFIVHIDTSMNLAKEGRKLSIYHESERR